MAAVSLSNNGITSANSTASIGCIASKTNAASPWYSSKNGLLTAIEACFNDFSRSQTATEALSAIEGIRCLEGKYLFVAEGSAADLEKFDSTHGLNRSLSLVTKGENRDQHFSLANLPQRTKIFLTKTGYLVQAQQNTANIFLVGERNKYPNAIGRHDGNSYIYPHKNSDGCELKSIANSNLGSVERLTRSIIIANQSPKISDLLFGALIVHEQSHLGVNPSEEVALSCERDYWDKIKNLARDNTIVLTEQEKMDLNTHYPVKTIP